MLDRKISRKLTGKGDDSCVVPASTYDVEAIALTEPQQRRLQVCENSWITRNAGVNRVRERD